MVVSLIILKIVLEILPDEKEIENFEMNDSIVFKYFVILSLIVFLIFIYNFKNIWINLISLFIYSQILNYINIEYYNILIYPIFYVFIFYLVYMFLNNIDYNMKNYFN